MSPNFYYDLAFKIGVFLQSKRLPSWSQWAGKMPKSEQMKHFGVYLGKGTIQVDGGLEQLYSTAKTCFGTDSTVVAEIDCKNMEWRENKVDGPLKKQLTS